MRDAGVLKVVRGAGGIVSSSELVAAGVRWEDLYRLRDAGALIEISRGVYRLAGAAQTAHIDLLAVCRRAPEGMICLNSAASFWQLTDEIPTRVHLAVARGAHRPRISYPATQVHVFAVGTFALGRVSHPLESGETINISSRERTVVDLMRLRSRVGRDLALGALASYMRGPHANPAALLGLARRLRAGTVLAGAMEPLLA